MNNHINPSTSKPLSNLLMTTKAFGARHGLVLPPQTVSLSQSDVSSITHMGVARFINAPWDSASGGVGREYKTAQLAAIGEGIERAVSAQAELNLKTRKEIAFKKKIDAEDFCLFTNEQRQSPNFPYNNIYEEGAPYTEVELLHDGTKTWVPQPFVSLQDPFNTNIPTSSGLAAGPTLTNALLRGIQELIERDALMVSWLHGVVGRRVKTTPHFTDEIKQLGGEVYSFDLTPKYSPFPVAAVAGFINKNGQPRFSLGVACRESWEAAEDKAYLEWNQGILFAGVYGEYVDITTLGDGSELAGFDQHAVFYTANPHLWAELKLFSDVETIHKKPQSYPYTSDKDSLSHITQVLKKNNIRLFYKDLTTIDAQQLGVSVVKALSPDMAQIYGHQKWPFLGKVEGLLKSRYPWAKNTEFPYMRPHPLG